MSANDNGVTVSQATKAAPVIAAERRTRSRLLLLREVGEPGKGPVEASGLVMAPA